MAIENIDISVYNTAGGIDSSLSPAISVYDNSDLSLDFSGTMAYNSTLQLYRFSPDIDVTKTYTAKVDFGVSATTRYASFAVTYTGPSTGALTSGQQAELTKAAKSLTRNEFIALQNP